MGTWRRCLWSTAALVGVAAVLAGTLVPTFDRVAAPVLGWTPLPGGSPAPVNERETGPAGSSTVDGAAPTRPATSGSPIESVASGAGAVHLRYTFDGGVRGAAGAVPDSAGVLPLHVRTANGATLSTVPHAGGLAVRFPPRCERYGAPTCARAILQSDRADLVNPGRSLFRYGATVRVAGSETSSGANVLQKGFAVGHSQFKLQVDGMEGRPSCVLVGTASGSIHVAHSSLTVADGQWHQVECVRGNSLLTIAVDGMIRGRTAIPRSLSIVNSDPLCIGGKGTSPNNDQFAGELDDVYVIRDA